MAEVHAGICNGSARIGTAVEVIAQKFMFLFSGEDHYHCANLYAMYKNALVFDRLRTDEMNILLSELNGKFPNLGVVTKHQNDWSASFQEAMEYLDSIDEGYNPAGYLRENWPLKPADGDQIDFFEKNKGYIDVTVNFNSSFLWLISFWYEWSINFMGFSCENCTEDIAERWFNLAVYSLDISCQVRNSYVDDWPFGPFDDMDAISGTFDFYLVGDMGGDEPFRPILFCKQIEFVEQLKNHPFFVGKCDYYSREEYLKDPVLNPLRLQLPPGV